MALSAQRPPAAGPKQPCAYCSARALVSVDALTPVTRARVARNACVYVGRSRFVGQYCLQTRPNQLFKRTARVTAWRALGIRVIICPGRANSPPCAAA